MDKPLLLLFLVVLVFLLFLSHPVFYPNFRLNVSIEEDLFHISWPDIGEEYEIYVDSSLFELTRNNSVILNLSAGDHEIEVVVRKMGRPILSQSISLHVSKHPPSLYVDMGCVSTSHFPIRIKGRGIDLCRLSVDGIRWTRWHPVSENISIVPDSRVVLECISLDGQRVVRTLYFSRQGEELCLKAVR